VPPQDIPDGKKPMVENAGFPLQSFGNTASKTTSFGMRTYDRLPLNEPNVPAHRFR